MSNSPYEVLTLHERDWCAWQDAWSDWLGELGFDVQPIAYSESARHTWRAALEFFWADSISDEAISRLLRADGSFPDLLREKLKAVLSLQENDVVRKVQTALDAIEKARQAYQKTIDRINSALAEAKTP